MRKLQMLIEMDNKEQDRLQMLRQRYNQQNQLNLPFDELSDIHRLDNSMQTNANDTVRQMVNDISDPLNVSNNFDISMNGQEQDHPQVIGQLEDEIVVIA